jgi:alanine-alpha-ketoisovalerate/valine-pyruvate aminotransferase
MEKLVRDNLGMSQSNQNITLNVNESTTNWSLFNIFDKKKNEETKKYQIKIDNTTEQIAL